MAVGLSNKYVGLQGNTLADRYTLLGNILLTSQETDGYNYAQRTVLIKCRHFSRKRRQEKPPSQVKSIGKEDEVIRPEKGMMSHDAMCGSRSARLSRRLDQDRKGSNGADSSEYIETVTRYASRGGLIMPCTVSSPGKLGVRYLD